jgi:peptidyl-dipeptidase Dcp
VKPTRSTWTKNCSRVDAVYQQRASLGLDEQALRLVELTHLDFTRAGAALDAQAKARMKEINARIAELDTLFAQNLLKETNAFELLVKDPADLSGLPANLVALGQDERQAKGQADAVNFGLDREPMKAS